MANQLCTLAAIKARLGLPAASGSEDAVLDAFRLAIEEEILARTGFTFSGGTKTEQHMKVQLGISRVMRQRPITPMSTNPAAAVRLSARSLASGTFSDILGDLIDPYEGRIMPMASELTPIFPPIGGLAPWFRWRQMVWEIVKFTYVVDPLGSGTNPIPAALERAAVEWTVSCHARAGGGAVESLSAEKVSENYIEQAEPPVVRMLLGRYLREKAIMVF